MPRLLALTLALALAAPAAAQSLQPANPQIDYKGFVQLAQQLEPVREAHRLPWGQFIAKARAEGALLLDARSESAFRRGHIKGAVNLPFSDFTDEALREVIGKNPNRPIYIYCNNNFTDNAAPVVTKRFDMALNIPTFVNLHGYGYGNVWELGGLVSTKQLGVDWVRGT
ncbi:MAG: rhodanese-like domain-containing protein [Sphingomonadales bacterium]|nr:rhodanese-like domain-containing protein [Sphingomonadales bacterium]